MLGYLIHFQKFGSVFLPFLTVKEIFQLFQAQVLLVTVDHKTKYLFSFNRYRKLILHRVVKEYAMARLFLSNLSQQEQEKFANVSKYINAREIAMTYLNHDPNL